MAPYYTDSSELDCTLDSDSIFTSEAESTDETVVPGTRRCVTPPKRCTWRLAQAANKTQMATATSGPTTRRAAAATPATTPPPLGPDPLQRSPPTIGSFANGRFPC